MFEVRFYRIPFVIRIIVYGFSSVQLASSFTPFVENDIGRLDGDDRTDDANFLALNCTIKMNEKWMGKKRSDLVGWRDKTQRCASIVFTFCGHAECFPQNIGIVCESTSVVNWSHYVHIWYAVYEIHFDFYFYNWPFNTWWLMSAVRRYHGISGRAYTHSAYVRRVLTSSSSSSSIKNKNRWNVFHRIPLTRPKKIVPRRINTIFEKSIEFNCYYLLNRCQH